MKKKPIKIGDIIDLSWYYPSGGEAVEYTFTYASHLFYDVVDDVRVPREYDIFPSTKFFLDDLLYHFEDRYIFIREDSETSAEMNLDFFYLVQEFYDGIGSNLADVLGTFEMEYNPIHNYDGDETRTLSHGQTYGRTDTNTHTHTNDKTTITNQYYGIDGAGAANVDTNTTERTGSDVFTNVQSGTDGYIDTETLTRGGNLGQTMTQTMQDAEKRNKMQNLYMQFIKLFIDEYTFYM